jgi:hypothetical protein
MSIIPDPNPQASDNPPKVRLAEGQHVNLGCGTLILIALIVLIFGRKGTGDLEREVRNLSAKIEQLEAAVKTQTSEIRSLEEKLASPNAESK